MVSSNFTKGKPRICGSWKSSWVRDEGCNLSRTHPASSPEGVPGALQGPLNSALGVIGNVTEFMDSPGCCGTCLPSFQLCLLPVLCSVAVDGNGPHSEAWMLFKDFTVFLPKDVVHAIDGHPEMYVWCILSPRWLPVLFLSWVSEVSPTCCCHMLLPSLGHVLVEEWTRGPVGHTVLWSHLPGLPLLAVPSFSKWASSLVTVMTHLRSCLPAYCLRLPKGTDSLSRARLSVFKLLSLVQAGHPVFAAQLG